MSAALLEQPTETLGTVVSCENCPAVQRLERALEKLTLEFRCEVGYWKSRHADAVKRIEQLKEELDQSRGETRALQDKLFGRKSEKSARSDRSNDLFDPEEVSAAGKNAVRSLAMLDTGGTIIPICRSRKNSSHCRKKRWPARIAES